MRLRERRAAFVDARAYLCVLKSAALLSPQPRRCFVVSCKITRPLMRVPPQARRKKEFMLAMHVMQRKAE